MTHSTKLSFESEPEGSSLRVEDRVIVRLWFDRLTTPRKIEGRRSRLEVLRKIEG